MELVCYRLLHYPIPEQETRTGQPQRDTRPFDIADYNIQKFDPQDRGTQEKFAPYFEKRGIDLCTQQTFHRDFCLATRHSEDGQRRTCLAFPMTLPEDADKIVGFEKRGHAYTDGNSSYDDMTEGNHSGEGVWIASPARTGSFGSQAYLLVRECQRGNGLLPPSSGEKPRATKGGLRLNGRRTYRETDARRA